MNRRRLLASGAAGGVMLLAGCLDTRIRPALPEEGTVRIRNRTDSSRTVEIQITNEVGATFVSETYTVSPRDTEGSEVSERVLVDTDVTYSVNVSTDDRQRDYEWDVREETGSLQVTIRETDIEFAVEPFERPLRLDELFG
ncbi:hypothetical protein RH858_16400 [Halalkaliarchaeum sp. AArc-GB]|uniref:twin-arginine translocation signal domain-containing protein n=1 Tax=Halalkaliarchaeum sp. AArc-GB TaxID=3074078 RepID=UPI00285CF803|nr:hypothetical protein [Halalkaliarchaeum sp. AArc-GB]MDR5674705.1 hypothetical protein [Halalkaliarchaeum sp. AArc-GB]